MERGQFTMSEVPIKRGRRRAPLVVQENEELVLAAQPDPPPLPDVPAGIHPKVRSFILQAVLSYPWLFVVCATAYWLYCYYNQLNQCGDHEFRTPSDIWQVAWGGVKKQLPQCYSAKAHTDTAFAYMSTSFVYVVNTLIIRYMEN